MDTLKGNGFSVYELDCNDSWVYKLDSSFAKIKGTVWNHCHKDLICPYFRIMESGTKWGQWEPSTRIMSFSLNLLHHYEWEAVEHVMKHEMAHQIVTEIFGMDCHQVSHGVAWGEACKMVGIEPVRCSSSKFLSEFKGVKDNISVHRVKKLMNFANGRGATEAEVENALARAQEIMLRNDIELSDIMEDKRVWVKRPIGKRYKRWATWMWSLGDLLSSHYNIKSICNYVGNGMNQLEIFGEPNNVDIAEYIAHALLTQATYSYGQFKKKSAKEATDRRNELKEQGRFYKTYKRISKRAFMEGLISGYTSKLAKERKVVIDKIEAEDGSIVCCDKRLLKEMYGKAYPRLRNSHYSGSRGGGRSEGMAVGSGMTLASGLHSNGNRGNYLT